MQHNISPEAKEQRNVRSQARKLVKAGEQVVRNDDVGFSEPQSRVIVDPG